MGAESDIRKLFVFLQMRDEESISGIVEVLSQ
jgi:hypothetical protein